MQKLYIVILVVLAFACTSEDGPLDAEDDNNLPPAEKKNILLISPNGGESYFVNDSITVDWEAENIDSIKIYFSNDEGVNWELINGNINALDKTYKFLPRSESSSKCLIKISSSTDSTLFDVSDAVFSFYAVVDFDASYFPLNIGNTYVYKVQKSSYPDWEPDEILEKVEIIGKKVFNGMEYYDFLTKDDEGNQKHEYFYVNDSSGIVYQYNDYAPGTDYQIADLSLSEGNHNWTSGATVDVTFSRISVLGILRSVRKYDYFGPFSQWKYYLTQNFGISYYSSSDESFNVEKILKGAVINNMVYGDTISIPIPPDFFRYFPLSIGNKWYYDYHYHYQDMFSGTSFDTTFVITMSIIDAVNSEGGGTYYLLSKDRMYGRDSTVINVWVNEENADFYYGTSSYPLTNFYKAPPFYTREDPLPRVETVAEYSAEILGFETVVRKAVKINAFDEEKYYFAKNFGMNGWSYLNERVSEGISLRGCIIDGVVYGDTSRTY